MPNKSLLLHWIGAIPPIVVQTAEGARKLEAEKSFVEQLVSDSCALLLDGIMQSQELPPNIVVGKGRVLDVLLGDSA